MRNKKNLLIVSPYSENGDLIRRSLSKVDSYNAKSVSTLHAISKYSDEIFEAESSIDLILMDLEIGVEKARDSIFIVREKNPNVQIIIISKNEVPEEIESLRPWNLLKKPFVERDLLDIIKRTITQKTFSVIDGKFLESNDLVHPFWARDKEKLINIMRDTLNILDAQEAILVSENEIIASVGSLQKNEMESCSNIINKYMDFSGHGELIKQVKLSDNNYLLHAHVITVGIIIALIFDPDTSYELIRGQTRHLARKITQPALPADDSISDSNPMHKMKNVPSNRLHSRETIHVKQFTKISDFEQPNNVYIQSQPVTVTERSVSNRGGELHSGKQREYSKNPSIIEKINRKRPSIISVGLSQLPFTCLLIPRLDPKSISNDILDFLEEKTPLIFLSYGWKLNDIMIKKDMMQWIAAIPPIIAPAFQIKTIRKETSKLIFENFPKISMNGLMKDFWVPGYLVAIGSERISEIEKEELIENYQQRYILDGPTNISVTAQKVLYNNY